MSNNLNINKLKGLWILEVVQDSSKRIANLHKIFIENRIKTRRGEVEGGGGGGANTAQTVSQYRSGNAAGEEAKTPYANEMPITSDQYGGNTGDRANWATNWRWGGRAGPCTAGAGCTSCCPVTGNWVGRAGWPPVGLRRWRLRTPRKESPRPVNVAGRSEAS